MIKLTLVKFIRQFSLKKSWVEFNHLFLQGLGITLGSILLVIASMAIYSHFIAKDYAWNHMNFWNQAIYLISKSAEGSAQQLSMLLSYNITVIAVIKMRKSNQLDGISLPTKLIESLALGLLIVFVATVLLGNGLYWFFSLGEEHYAMFVFVKWLTTIINIVLPAAAFYLGYYFLKRGMEKPQQKFWPDFLRLLVVYTIIMAFVSLLIVVFSQVALQPMAFVLGGLNNSLVSIVLLSFMVLAMLVFFVIVAADLLIILIDKKSGAPAVSPKTNPDLLDH